MPGEILEQQQKASLVYSETIYKRLSKYFGRLKSPLKYTKDYELVIAVILSAQCTDERVNQVTRELFKKYRSLQAFADANLDDLEEIIFPTGFFRNKSKQVKGFAEQLIKNFDSQLPDSIEKLTSLPGVGRKTANVVIGEVFGKAEGIVVDTHVKRIAAKLGLTTETHPENIEYDLMEKIHPKYWRRFSLYLIFLGRKHCKAHKTDCANCPLQAKCPSSILP
ncbi:MAG: endonuclease III [Spirochaetota bacterium]